MSKKTIVIISVVVNLILLSLVIYYKKEDKRYISKVTEKDNISMLKIVGEDTEIIKQVPQSGQWSMSYTCDDENAELYWNEKKRTVVAKNISATECTLIFRESDAIFRMISMYVDGEYVTELDNTKKYEMESYECTNGEELTWDTNNSKLSIQPISKDTSCYVNFNVKYFTLTETMLAAEEAQSDVSIDYGYTSEGCSQRTYNSSTKEYECSSYDSNHVTNGLYYTSDLTKTEGGKVVYYYRGAVENNYLVFGEYCWRIVRTVEDGSVRLRYGGTPTQNGETYTCPQTGTTVNIESWQPFTEDYGSHISYLNYKTSNIRTTVENWYRDNLYKNGTNIKVTNLIADTPYCNDMSYRIESIYDKNYDAYLNVTYFGAYDRLSDYGTNKYNPQYKCPSSTYGYTVAKGDLTYPIALLTADEVAYAGGRYGAEENTSYYLNTGEGYWTMTPYYVRADMSTIWFVSNSLAESVAYGTYAAVPAVSLKPEAKVKSGTGLYNDPYIIKTN